VKITAKKQKLLELERTCELAQQSSKVELERIKNERKIAESHRDRLVQDKKRILSDPTVSQLSLMGFSAEMVCAAIPLAQRKDSLDEVLEILITREAEVKQKIKPDHNLDDTESLIQHLSDLEQQILVEISCTSVQEILQQRNELRHLESQLDKAKHDFLSEQQKLAQRQDMEDSLILKKLEEALRQKQLEEALHQKQQQESLRQKQLEESLRQLQLEHMEAMREEQLRKRELDDAERKQREQQRFQEERLRKVEAQLGEREDQLEQQTLKANRLSLAMSQMKDLILEQQAALKQSRERLEEAENIQKELLQTLSSITQL